MENELPGIENEWPPLMQCAQFKSGLIQRYLIKKDWESNRDLNDDQRYDADVPIPYCLQGTEIDMDFNTIGMAKRFLHQIRSSRGYDVDCFPPRSLDSPFYGPDPEHPVVNPPPSRRLNCVIQMAIDYINDKTRKQLEMVRVLRHVETVVLADLITFTAREVGSRGRSYTFLAMVCLDLDNSGYVSECILKPEGPPPEYYATTL